MKLINTEAQQALQKVFETLSENPALSVAERAELKYWAIEMKPKRVRRKAPEVGKAA